MHETVEYSGAALTALEELRARALAYPEAIEVEQFGHPWFKAGKRPFAIFGGRDDAPTVAFGVSKEDQVALCEMAPDLFFPTPYMHQHGWTSLRVGDGLDWATAGDLLDTAYRRVALQRMLNALDEA